MWLRLALNLSFVILISACSSSDRQTVDKLNSLSYVCHYRNIDSTEHFARQALQLSDSHDDARAEALNNLAFAAMARMEYNRADSLLGDVTTLTDNQLELLVAAIQHMRLCQRRSNNRAFYEYREKALDALKRINEERNQLSRRQLRRLVYAESEMAIVTSTYYYYVGLERQSVEALLQLNQDEVRNDTAQYLNYLYNVGAGGILTEGTAEEIYDEEMDFLNRCLFVSQRNHYVYFEAQAKEALADHTGDVQLAEEALQLFQSYGDVYQIAGAYRTLASCYHVMGDDVRALEYLHQALADERINQAPDLVAGIREQLSVAYAAVNDKQQSDYNRNIYIDLQEQTRQDRELEARAGLLDRSISQLNWMILAVLGTIVLLVFLLWLFNRQNRRQQEDNRLNDLLEQKEEEVAEARLRVAKNERRFLEQRAKVSLAVSILPLIERIIHTIEHLSLPADHIGQQSEAVGDGERLDYIRELTDNINERNEQLTQWIRLRQGELNLHIESFPLQPLFDMVSRSQRNFSIKGLLLSVEPTDAVVKADRVLTLFMLNTLADNARKFTPRGGRVSVSATQRDAYVEIAVSDTGCGMSDEQLAHIFDNKPIRDDSDSHQVQGSHGFGLMNCKGIIEKYRKMSQFFSVCHIAAESRQGEGSRFFFRLPKGMARLVIGLGCWLMATGSYAVSRPSSSTAPNPLNRAHVYADSAYFCNINGHYRRTLLFADSCRQCLNDYYRQRYPKGRSLMTYGDDGSVTPAEILWLHDGVDTNYQIILDIRNESAVAALALHEWALYTYNNKVYTQLFKELSADTTLADYCRTMQQSRTNKRIAVILLLVLLVLILPAYYMLYYRHRLYRQFSRERQKQTGIEMADDELRRAELEDSNLHIVNAVLDNCLSTLKHETMYYPSRIRQLVDKGDMLQLSEVAAYYRDLYGILIRQATAQTERLKLHMQPVMLYNQTVLGDENLLHYLFELIKPVGEVASEAKDNRYVSFRVKGDFRKYAANEHAGVRHSDGPDGQALVHYYLCRQIVRDHGEATNRRGCGITIEDNQVTIILPRYNGKL